MWPFLKVKLIYFWWIVKYGGKKNIPPELIFARMQTSMERMNKNLMEALRHLPSDAGEEEQQKVVTLVQTAADLEDEIKHLRG